MSRKFVRNTVATFIQPPNVAGIAEVFTAKPRAVDQDDYRFGFPKGTQSGAICYPFIGTEREQRLELVGSNALGKIVVYDVELALRFHSSQKRSEDAQDDYDDMVDALKTRIRSDSYLGDTTQTIWFSSEGDLGSSVDLEHRCTIPQHVGTAGGGTLVIWGSLKFRVCQHL